MANYTPAPITVSGVGEVRLDQMIKEINDARAAETPPQPPITKLQYINSVMSQWATSLEQQAKENFFNRVNVEMRKPETTIQNLVDVANVFGLDPNPYD